MPSYRKIPPSFFTPATLERYAGILLRDRPAHEGDAFSRRHPRMTRLNRAKLFAPFAALAGFDERVRKKEAPYVARHELDADETWALNHALAGLHRRTASARLARENRVRVRVEYFAPCADEENDAYGKKGRYETAEGTVLRVDARAQALVILSGGAPRAIPFADIYSLRETPRE